MRQPDKSAENRSPRIISHAWGRLEVEGETRFRDAKLFPGGAREWDWRETGTHHVPGIQPADVEELLEHDADVVVLSRGRHERLRVCDETIALLQKNGIEYHVLETGAAVEMYNQLAANRRVAGLIHSTC